ncbi:MAG: tetratricopeptide repeat-containing sensor histidine kinase [Bacteroidota bacterium]
MDTTRLTLLLEVAYLYCFVQPETAIAYAKKAITFSKKLGDKNAEGEALFYTGIAYVMQDKNDEAIIQIKKSIPYFKASADSVGLADAYNGLGNIYRMQSNFPVALAYFLRSLQLKEAVATPEDIAGAYIGIGSTYLNLEAYPKAIHYFKKALRSFEGMHHQKGIAIASTNLGNTYQQLEQFNQAIIYLHKALVAERAGGNRQGIIRVYTNLGIAYQGVKAYDKALHHYQQAFSLIEETGISDAQVDVLLGVATVHYFQKKNTVALQKNTEAMALAKQTGRKQTLQNIYELAADIYATQGDYQAAFEHHQSFVALKDSLQNKENDRKIIQLQMQYDYEKREQQLKLAQAKKTFALKERLQRQRYLLYGGLLAAFFLAVIAVVYYRYNRRLKQLNATKDQLFTMVAHDLKNPLSSFQNITHSLTNNIHSLEKNEIKRFLEKINKSSVQLYNLLEGLLQWAINQAGQLAYLPKETNVKETVQTVTDQLRTSAEVKRIQIKETIPETLTLQTDAKMLRIILHNLISNAIKFTPERGKVEMSAKQVGSEVHISVKDSGRGISEVNQARLFKNRLSADTIEEVAKRGTGLGLLLSKELVERLKGTIQVESQLQKGSNFTISLPQTTS